ncbi:hypothetical protein [Nocardioides sp.]|uniref:hypothetical protein n=1 Tax=Nocardioides sp. TaxID=35761 RepID=UPI0035669E8C
MTPDATAALLAMQFAVTPRDALLWAMRAVLNGCPAATAHEAWTRWDAANRPQVIGGAR